MAGSITNRRLGNYNAEANLIKEAEAVTTAGLPDQVAMKERDRDDQGAAARKFKGKGA
jgi:hypothetical protein